MSRLASYPLVTVTAAASTPGVTVAEPSPASTTFVPVNTMWFAKNESVSVTVQLARAGMRSTGAVQVWPASSVKVSLWEP